MAYILAINPQILSRAGIDFDAALVATILATAFSCLTMAVLANYPFALAPGMGLNAYFTYGIVLGAGHDWQTALGACFWAGLILLILNLTQLRAFLMHAIPIPLRLGATGGIGLFLALIGLKSSHILIVKDAHPATLGSLQSAEVLLTLLGVLTIGTLLARGWRAAIFCGMALNYALGGALGLIDWQGFVTWPPSLLPTFGKLEIGPALHLDMIPTILSLLFVMLFDSANALLSLGSQAALLNDQEKLPRAQKALYADALGTTAGALLGTSPISIYLESASGISAGGKTGITPLIVALCFLLCLFFSPLVLSIPAFATAPALIVMGALMLQQLRFLNFNDLTDLLPAFLIVLTIPLSFSIPTGISLGFILYPLLKLLSGHRHQVPLIVWLLAILFSTTQLLTIIKI